MNLHKLKYQKHKKQTKKYYSTTVQWWDETAELELNK